jgi:hypothetical protein
MIVDINGNARCDGCGLELGMSPSPIVALIVNDLNEDGTVRLRQFCRVERNGAPRGCAGKLMSAGNLKWANATDEEIAAAQPEPETQAQVVTE